MKKIWDDSSDMGRLLLAAKAKYPHIRNFADIARQLDVGEAVLSNWKTRGIPAAKIFELSETFSCDPKWMATGKGKMTQIDQNPYGLDWGKWTLEKVEHAKEIEEMPEDEFSSQKVVLKAVVESTKKKGKPGN